MSNLWAQFIAYIGSRNLRQWVRMFLALVMVICLFIDLRLAAGVFLCLLGYWIFFDSNAYGAVGRWLSVYEWLWTVPVGLLAFWFVGYLLQDMLGLAVGTYDFSFLQPFFLSQVITILMFAGATLSLRLNWTKMFHYWTEGKKYDKGNQISSDIDQLKPSQRILFLFGIIYLYVGVTLVIYKTLV